MTATDAQIKSAFEQNEMSPDEIASDLGFEVAAVKAKLIQLSSKYRKACGMEAAEEDDLNFSEDELRRVNSVIIDCALAATLPDGSVDYKTRLKAAEYVRDDKKGRKEVVRAVQNNTFNILDFNAAQQQARIAAQQARKQLVDV